VETRLRTLEQESLLDCRLAKQKVKTEAVGDESAALSVGSKPLWSNLGRGSGMKQARKGPVRRKPSRV
jgi:hypothetical protein